MRLGKERRDLVICKSGYAASDAGDQERQFGMLLGKIDKLIHVGTDGLHTALHGWNGVALPLQAYALTYDGTKLQVGYAGSSTAMPSSQVAAKHENLVGFKVCNEFRGSSLLFHNRSF